VQFQALADLLPLGSWLVPTMPKVKRSKDLLTQTETSYLASA
jgi:hypothetical protein